MAERHCSRSGTGSLPSVRKELHRWKFYGGDPAFRCAYEQSCGISASPCRATPRARAQTLASVASFNMSYQARVRLCGLCGLLQSEVISWALGRLSQSRSNINTLVFVRLYSCHYAQWGRRGDAGSAWGKPQQGRSFALALLSCWTCHCVCGVCLYTRRWCLLLARPQKMKDPGRIGSTLCASSAS